MSDLQHRMKAAIRESFALPEIYAEGVEMLVEDAQEALDYDPEGVVDPDFNEAWDCLFEAERIIAEYAASQRMTVQES